MSFGFIPPITLSCVQDENFSDFKYDGSGIGKTREVALDVDDGDDVGEDDGEDEDEEEEEDDELVAASLVRSTATSSMSITMGSSLPPLLPLLLLLSLLPLPLLAFVSFSCESVKLIGESLLFVVFCVIFFASTSLPESVKLIGESLLFFSFFDIDVVIFCHSFPLIHARNHAVGTHDI